MTSISIIGAGAWGTALAQLMATTGKSVTLCARDPALAAQINTHRTNHAYLPGITLHPGITATAAPEHALSNDILLLVTPAQALRATLETLKPGITSRHILVICAKGIEISSGKLMSEVTADILPQTRIAILTGPNFAHEIAALKPAATTLACADEKIAQTLQNVIAAPSFRPYTTTDVIGAQIAGALKNVIAIACGMARGLNMGESAQASLVTRGMAEIVRLGLHMGGRQETFLGLSGMGDMILTCSSQQSRNFSLGLSLGQGLTMAQIMADRRSITEGVHTARAAIALAQKYDVDMPVCKAVHQCVNEALPLQTALHNILNRPLGEET
jgi:glycerol-3-phosphate dehydrogenase (NAD(P)+)